MSNNIPLSLHETVRSRSVGDSVCFDARVHRTAVRAADSIMTILLRRNDEMLCARLEPSLTDVCNFDTAATLTTESLVRISGVVTLPRKKSENSSLSRALTIQVSAILVLSAAVSGICETTMFVDSPSGSLEQPKTLSIDERLDTRLLDTRIAANAAIFKLSSGVHELAVEYLAALEFYHVSTPAFVTYMWPCEENDHFEVDYFGQKAWLAPTGEVHLGMALSADLERVYDIHNVFRREPDADGRHLTEFTMLEVVFNIQHNWEEILDLAGDLLIFLAKRLQEREKYKKLLDVARSRHPQAGDFRLGLTENGKLKRITFCRAKEILRDTLGRKTDVSADLTREEEFALGEHIGSNESCLGTPADLFIVTHFPKHLRPCNIHPSKDTGVTNSFDVILRGQEIITGCQLLHSHQDLREAFATRVPPIDSDSPGWRSYVEAHEIGMPPWGGFGRKLTSLSPSFSQEKRGLN
ncbi:hypothetical protein PWT90_06034 [Aphanocladium album]|nr:hypothetical protein PWT90_06034 [Aphanocladium album]